MIRRKFINVMISFAGTSLILMLSSKISFAGDILSKIRQRLSPPAGPNPDSRREDASLPQEGPFISIETAINTRCTGDYDDDPRKIHWGMFDKDRKLTSAQIEHIRKAAIIPRFTDAGVDILAENNMLLFTIDNSLTQPVRKAMMIESGMQQQAVGLVCAALGVGYVFRTLGVEGKLLRGKYSTTRTLLEPLKPSYNGTYWTSKAPSQPHIRISANLTDPARQGSKPLLDALAILKKEQETGRQATIKDISQLLWAARGRTPHFSISSPWGMTIPTYNVREVTTHVHVISEQGIYRYDNGTLGNPAHALELLKNNAGKGSMAIKDQYEPYNALIVLGTNGSQAKSLWEIGYQLLNLMLQAHSLDIAYKAILLNEDQKQTIRIVGIKEPVAAFCIKYPLPTK